MTPARRTRSSALHHPARTVRWVASLAAALLAACGGSSSDSPSGDTTPPALAITDDVSAATATGNVTFTFTFSEDIGTTFTAADVNVAGGTKGAFTRSSATVYTVVVAPTANAAGSIDVSVPAGSFSDVAGNANAGSSSATQAYDTRVPSAQMTLPVTFDSPTVAYALVGFGGADDSSIAVDPANPSNHVAKVVKSAAAETWAGTTVGGTDGSGFASPIPFDASNTRMTVRVWSPDAGITVRLKAEDHTNATVTVETEAVTTAAGAWETLTFDFAHAATGTAALNVAATYDKVSIFFNFGVNGATAGEKTYYFDDLVFVGGGGTGGGGSPAFTTVTFEGSEALTGFGGADDSSIAADPADASNHVAKVVKSATAETWAGTTFSTGADATVGKIPFDAANTRMTVRVWSPDTGIKVRLKVEDHTNGAVSVETEATTSVANAWETLTFDFAQEVTGAALNVANTYDRATIFFNFGVAGATAGAKTYYFDDVTFIGGGGIGGGGGAAFSTVTFDASGVTYTLVGFGGADNSTVAADPADATNHVAKVVRSGTAETWAGTTFSTGAANTVGKIPFEAAKTRMTVRVWSPDVGVVVRLKVEDHASSAVSVETEATTTVASAWETLTFDFAHAATGTAALNLAATYDKASIFFAFGTAGSAIGEKTYYFDDVTFLP